jgi:hypothetical protein
LNVDVVFGFRVDDVTAASAELAAEGCELIGDINFVEQLNDSWRDYRGPDGRVYGINQQY